jgi:hypothetical protein
MARRTAHAVPTGGIAKETGEDPRTGDAFRAIDRRSRRAFEGQVVGRMRTQARERRAVARRGVGGSGTAR